MGMNLRLRLAVRMTTKMKGDNLHQMQTNADFKRTWMLLLLLPPPLPHFSQDRQSSLSSTTFLIGTK
jgi:hypothetical protein